MPMRRRFYDPFVQAMPVEEKPSQVTPGVYVHKEGIFFHVDDVVAALRQMGDDNPQFRDALYAAADGFANANVQQ